jgi:hypothetical protein
MERDERFWKALEQQAEEDRFGPDEQPAPDEVLAFVEGRLEGAEHERVADAIAASPSAARLARDLARFPTVEPDRGAEPAMTETEAAAAWRAIAGKLEIASEAPRLGTRQPPARSRTSAPWWVAAAAALAGIVVGVAGQRLAVYDAPQPNPEVRTLMPRGEGVTRGAEPRPLPGHSDSLVVVLAFAGPLEPGGHGLALRDASGRLLWFTRGLRRRADGTFTVTIPASYLGSGIYTLQLHRSGDLRSPPLATYDLDLRRSLGG